MISLNYRDARPIYEQVKDGLRHLVMAGAIQPGDMLPSVRALASSLAINPNTIQRAYEALEGEGYLYTVAGKGAFAAGQADIEERRRGMLLDRFDTTAAELLFLGMTAQELAERLRMAETAGASPEAPAEHERSCPSGPEGENGTEEVRI